MEFANPFPEGLPAVASRGQAGHFFINSTVPRNGEPFKKKTVSEKETPGSPGGLSIWKDEIRSLASVLVGLGLGGGGVATHRAMINWIGALEALAQRANAIATFWIRLILAAGLGHGSDAKHQHRRESKFHGVRHLFYLLLSIEPPEAHGQRRQRRSHPLLTNQLFFVRPFQAVNFPPTKHKKLVYLV
jgi:hypothetical protein